METYDLSSRMRRLIRMMERVSSSEGESSPASRNEEIEDTSLSHTLLARKLLGKMPSGITSKTFIIPVQDGMVSGYLFERQRSQQVMDLTPLIIYYHGGGWTWGNMEVYNLVCANLANLTGASVLSVDYRLAPQHKFPTAVEDCYDTLLWAAAGCRYWKTDPDRIYLIGDSAGGNLAAVVSRLSRDRKGPPIAGQVLIYPVTDGRMRTESHEEFKDSPTLTDKQMSAFIANYMREPKDILNPLFSPLLAKDHSRLPETLIIGAEYDPLRDDGRLYAEALLSADTAAKYLEVKKTVHGFFLYPKATGTDEAESAIVQFVGGRAVEQVALITRKEWVKAQRRERKQIKRQAKHYIDVIVE